MGHGGARRSGGYAESEEMRLAQSTCCGDAKGCPLVLDHAQNSTRVRASGTRVCCLFQQSVSAGGRRGRRALGRPRQHAPDPTTTKMKKPSITGPTGMLLLGFCGALNGRSNTEPGQDQRAIARAQSAGRRQP